MKEFFLNIKKDIVGIFPQELRKNLTAESIFYRSINFIFFSWLMSLYVYLPFLVYMSNYGFFSYDLFNNGFSKRFVPLIGGFRSFDDFTGFDENQLGFIIDFPFFFIV